MPELFRREWALRIGRVRISGQAEGEGDNPRRHALDINFEVQKSVEREPNTAKIQVYNLSPHRRAQVRETEDLTVKLEAGYVGQTSVLFEGDVRTADSVPDGVDVIITLECEDGGTAYRATRVNRSFEAGTSVQTVLRAAAEAMGVGDGNLREVSQTVELEGGGTMYPEGTVLSGRACDEVDRIARSCGLTWSVQNGVLQFRRGSQPLETTAIRLTPNTGLIGSPSRVTETQGQRHGLVDAMALLIPGLYPARKVVLESREVEGQFQVHRVKHIGDSAGADWFAELTLEPY